MDDEITKINNKFKITAVFLAAAGVMAGVASLIQSGKIRENSQRLDQLERRDGIER